MMKQSEFTVDSFDPAWICTQADIVLNQWKEVVAQHPECDMDQMIKSLAISCMIYAWNNPQ